MIGWIFKRVVGSRANEWLDGVLITKLWLVPPPGQPLLSEYGIHLRPVLYLDEEEESLFQCLALSRFLFELSGQLFVCLV